MSVHRSSGHVKQSAGVYTSNGVICRTFLLVNMLPGFIRLSWLVIVIAGLISCKTAPERLSSADPAQIASVTTEDAPVPRLTAVRANRNKGKLYIHLLENGADRYTEVELAMDELNEQLQQSASSKLDPYLLGIKKLYTDDSLVGKFEGAQLTVLGAEVWHEMLNQLFASLMAQTPKHGLVVGLPHQDYFLYLDSAGAVRATVLRHRPTGYRIGGVVRLEELIAAGTEKFRGIIGNRHLTGSEFLLNTGAQRRLSIPFLYVDLATDSVALIAYEWERASGPGRSSGFVSGETIAHLVKTHVWDLMVRPVSSINRLIFMTTDTAVDTLRPDWVTTLAETPIPPVNEDVPGMNLTEWEAELDDLTRRSSSRGEITYLVDGMSFFTRFIETVLAARDSVRMRIYIFDNDDVAKEIADLLRERSKQGVKVKILLDGIGTTWAAAEHPESMPKEHEPPRSIRTYLESDSKIEVRIVPNLFLTGDHVKTLFIDHSTAFLGGMNIGREYRFDWHDMMVELRGPVVDELSADFNRAWAHAGTFGDFGYPFSSKKSSGPPAENTGYPIRVLYTKTARSEIFFSQLRAIRRAQKYIYIENAYFTDDAILYELVRARRRGVDVRVIMPMETDAGLITRNNALAANTMIENGIRVFIYPGMSHLKAAVYDGWACFGSANFDRLSLRINKEINLATSNPIAVDGLMKEVFRPDFERSVELTEPLPNQFIDYLLEILGDYFY